MICEFYISTGSSSLCINEQKNWVDTRRGRSKSLWLSKDCHLQRQPQNKGDPVLTVVEQSHSSLRFFDSDVAKSWLVHSSMWHHLFLTEPCQLQICEKSKKFKNLSKLFSWLWKYGFRAFKDSNLSYICLHFESILVQINWPKQLQVHNTYSIMTK